MKKHNLAGITEESILLFSITKWVFLASIIGVLVGFSTSIFLKTLHYAIDFTSEFNYYYLLLPFGF